MLLLAVLILVGVGAAVCASRSSREGLRGRRGRGHRHGSGRHDLLHLGRGQYYGPWASPSWLDYGYGGLYGGALRGYGGRYGVPYTPYTFRLSRRQCQNKCSRQYRACKDAAVGSKKRKALCKESLADCVEDC